MIEIFEKKKCSGCYACANVCPKKCISMEVDEEGFWYPKIDKSRCINCGLCEKICPILNNKKKVVEQTIAYGCYNKNEEIRKKSSSGGVFTLLAEEILSNKGVVFGASLNEKFAVEHIAVDKVEDLEKLRVSKYVQSKIGDTYSQAKKFLDSGREVLFTGTPCQIGGLVSFLGKEYENLYTQDIICHGVPSPAVWEKYVEYKQKSGEIDKIIFRRKFNTWKKYSFSIVYKNGEEYNRIFAKDPYLKMFLHNKCLRPSCHDCPFKGVSRNCDVTLGDFWGVTKVVPEFNDDKGVSLVIVHSEKGKKLFDAIKEKLVFKEVDLDVALKHNVPMLKSVKPFNREKMMSDFKNLPFEKVVRKHGKGIY